MQKDWSFEESGQYSTLAPSAFKKKKEMENDKGVESRDDQGWAGCD